jgi:hypothetical protein
MLIRFRMANEISPTLFLLKKAQQKSIFIVMFVFVFVFVFVYLIN